MEIKGNKKLKITCLLFRSHFMTAQVRLHQCDYNDEYIQSLTTNSLMHLAHSSAKTVDMV